MSVVREQAAATGARTLENFADTPRLNAWMYDKFASGVRGDVLEIGSGIGNISRLLRPNTTSLVVTDVEDGYLRALSDLFAGDSAVAVESFDLDRPPPPPLAARRFDAIVAINVIEHIADDVGLVRRLTDLLRPGGRLLVYVPAVPAAFGSMDVALGHHRRYTPDTLSTLLRSADLDAGDPRYVNLLGLAGWFVSGRVLRRSTLSTASVSLFERIVPFVRLEDRVRLPIGLGLWTQAIKPG